MSDGLDDYETDEEIWFTMHREDPKMDEYRELSMEEFFAEMDRLHQPKDGPDGKVCITCDPAQGWKCITRVLLDSTVF